LDMEGIMCYTHLTCYLEGMLMFFGCLEVVSTCRSEEL
jgi:hypothetical protein